VHDRIDSARPHEFLDAELQRITGDSEIGRGYSDRLVKAHSHEGAKIWALGSVLGRWGQHRCIAPNLGLPDRDAALVAAYKGLGRNGA
jgi:hypothetical protein